MPLRARHISISPAAVLHFQSTAEAADFHDLGNVCKLLPRCGCPVVWPDVGSVGVPFPPECLFRNPVLPLAAGAGCGPTTAAVRGSRLRATPVPSSCPVATCHHHSRTRPLTSPLDTLKVLCNRVEQLQLQKQQQQLRAASRWKMAKLILPRSVFTAR